MAINLITGAVGAVGGAAIGAVASVAASVAQGKEVDWGSVGAAAAGGAAAGGLAGVTMGGSLAVSAGGLAAGGAAGGATERTLDNVAHDREWHEGVAKHAAIGGAIGAAGGATLRAAGPAIRSAAAPALRGAGRALGSGWQAYRRALARHPLITKSVTSGTITGGGDVLAQSLTSDAWDPTRTAFMTAYGLLWVGPATHYAYGLLGRLIPGQGLLAGVGRAGADLVTLAPTTNAVYFASLGAFQGDSPGEAWDRVRRNALPTTVDGWKLWGPGNLVNFTLVPQQFRVLFANVLGLGWTTFLSATTAAERRWGEDGWKEEWEEDWETGWATPRGGLPKESLPRTGEGEEATSTREVATEPASPDAAQPEPSREAPRSVNGLVDRVPDDG